MRTKQIKTCVGITTLSAAILAASLLLPCSAAAEPIPFLFKTTRALGMGDAFSAVADDRSAAFYNPAGLALLPEEGMDWDVPILQGEMNSAGSTVISDLANVDTKDLVEVTEVLADHLGDPIHTKLTLYPSWTRRFVHVGLLVQTTADGQIRNPVNPRVELATAIDIGLVVGGAYSFLEEALLVGATMKLIYRQGQQDIYTAVDITNEELENPMEELEGAFGVGLDIGAMYIFRNLSWAPSVALVVQNMGDVSFGDAGSRLPAKLNLGFAARPVFGGFHPVFALDFKDLTFNATEDGEFPKRIHLGAEVRHESLSWLRPSLGFYQGYMTGGVTLAFSWFQLEFASYAEELGVYAGQNQDRRFVLRFNFTI